MRLAVLAWALSCTILLCPATYAVTPKGVETIPVSQIHAGMHGVAYTVFEGVKPEPMEVENVPAPSVESVSSAFEVVDTPEPAIL